MTLKHLILFISSLIGFINLTAQSGITAKLIPVEDKSANITMPRFPGGEEAFYQFLADNIRYPYLLVKIKMEGNANIRFTINTEGEVSKADITLGFDPLADNEVLRVIKSMPKWNPATENGTPISMDQKLAVTFTLNDELLKKAEEMEVQGADNNAYIEFQPAKDSMENPDISEKTVENIAETTEKTDTLLNKSPRFPGGKEAMEAYFKNNMKYPKRAIQMGIEGRVIFNVLISAEGEIAGIALFKGIFRDCNEEAFYLIKKMPKWIPGLRDGKPTAMEVILPVPFELPR